MAKENEAQKLEEKKERFVLQDVPTQTQPMIVDTKNKEVYTVEAALIRILNTLEVIEQSVG